MSERPPDGYEDAQVPPDGYEEPAKGTGPTKLDKVAAAITQVMQRVNNPGGQDMSGVNSLGMGDSGDALFNRAGEATSEFLGRHGANPYVAAGAGTVVSMANPMNWMAPEGAGGASVQIKKPLELPPNEAAAGVKFTRPEMTQNPTALSAQRIVQQTPVGGLMLDPFKAEQAAQLEAYANKLQQKHGTSELPTTTGGIIRSSADAEAAANTAVNDALYKKVPMDTQVPHSTFVDLYNTLEAKLAPRIKRLVKGNDVSTEANPVRPGDTGEVKGVTNQIQQPGPDYQPSLAPNKVTPEYKVGYEATPGKPTQLPNTPTLEQLKQLRTELGAEAQKGGVDGFHAGLLRNAITKDIENLASNGSLIDKFVGKDAADAFRTATQYNRELRDLSNHPIARAVENAKIEDLPDVIFKGGKVENVQVGRAVLGETGFKAAQKSFFTDLLHTKDIGKALDKFDEGNPEFIKQALTPQQLEALKTIDALKKRAASAGNVAPMAGSSKMNMWLALAHGMVTNPIKTLLTGAALPGVVADRMMAAQPGMTLRVGAAPIQGLRVAAAAAAQPRTKMDVLRGYIQKQRQSPGS